MYNNFGLQNEVELENAINGKRFSELNENLQRILTQLFGRLSEDDVFICKRTDNYIKPDIVISCRGKDCYISVKCNHSKYMHTETIKNFILFLRSLGVSEETQKTLLLYQYGDGTMDGNGERRMNRNQVYDWLGEKIKKVNRELNNRMDLIEKVVDRVMFQGVDLVADSADYIYHGTVDFGIIVSKRQIKSYLKRGDWFFYDNVHIGPIMIRPHARYADRAIVSDERRNHVMCSWANFENDLKFIAKHFAF